MALHNKKKAFMVAMGSYGCVLPFQAIGFDAVVLTDENMNSVPQMVHDLLMKNAPSFSWKRQCLSVSSKI